MGLYGELFIGKDKNRTPCFSKSLRRHLLLLLWCFLKAPSSSSTSSNLSRRIIIIIVSLKLSQPASQPSIHPPTHSLPCPTYSTLFRGIHLVVCQIPSCSRNNFVNSGRRRSNQIKDPFDGASQLVPGSREGCTYKRIVSFVSFVCPQSVRWQAPPPYHRVHFSAL